MNVQELNKKLRNPFDEVYVSDTDSFDRAVISNNKISIYVNEENPNILFHEFFEGLLYKEGVFDDNSLSYLSEHIIIDLSLSYVLKDYYKKLKDVYKNMDYEVHIKKHDKYNLFEALNDEKKEEAVIDCAINNFLRVEILGDLLKKDLLY